jgi:hypothetical protein
MWQINTIKKYKNLTECFIETGTWKGDGIQVALDLGFNTIYSCDIDEENVNRAKIRFKDKKVHLIHANSSLFLKKILPKLKQSSFIWLDAHVMADHTGKVFSDRQLNLASELNIGVCPLLDELQAIFKYSKIEHTILIDDYHCFGTWEFNNLTVDDVKTYILNKNSNYKFSVEENILCCFI